MEHKEVIANIKVTPTISGQSNIDITMPIWIKKDELNSKFYVNLALLGGITTVVEKESEIDQAIKEAIKGFFLSSVKFGKGFTEELSFLGWQIKSPKSIRYRIPRKDRGKAFVKSNYNLLNSAPAMKQMMLTGTSKSLSLQV